MDTTIAHGPFPGRLLLRLLCAATVLACNSPRVEMKDPESFAKTVEKLKESLSEEEAKRLQEATIVVMADTVKPPVPLMKVKPEQWEQIHARLEGKTPRQIIALADEIRARDAAAGAGAEAAEAEAPAPAAVAPAPAAQPAPATGEGAAPAPAAP